MNDIRDARTPKPPSVAPFFDEATGTWSYVVADLERREAAVIDPVLDFEARSGRTSAGSADRLLAHLEAHRLTLRWILETHAHADHLSAAPYMQSRAGGLIAIGAGILSVQATFKRVFGLGADFAPDGSQFDRLVEDGETIEVGELVGRVIATPGHTSDSVSYLFGDALFVGDTVFMPEGGSARCDFPGGDAAQLYRSVQRLYALPAGTRVFVCHDYPADGQPARCETTIGEQRAANIHLRSATTSDEFVAMRRARDATLAVPNLLIPSVQVNIRGGRLPPPEADGVRYLRVPLDVIGSPPAQ